MSEYQKYTPENMPYGTKHDGEMVFSEDMEFRLSQSIDHYLAELSKHTSYGSDLPLPSLEIERLKQRWINRAKELFAEYVLLGENRLDDEDAQANFEIVLEKLQDEMMYGERLPSTAPHDDVIKSELGIENKNSSLKKKE